MSGLPSLDRALTPRERKALYAQAKRIKARKDSALRAHADYPGSGPSGETCKTCRHLCRKEMSKTYLKCGLIDARWTGGAGTDVKASDPACSKWESVE